MVYKIKDAKIYTKYKTYIIVFCIKMLDVLLIIWYNVYMIGT